MSSAKRKTAPSRVPVDVASPAYPFPGEAEITVDELRHLIDHHEGALTLVINPNVATWVLDAFNGGNRKLSETRSLRYAEDMEAGRWRFTGENIIFSRSALNTGQHRLRAIALWGKPLKVSVMFGVSRDAFVVTDTGRSHSSADVLAVHGTPNSALCAATLRWLIAYEQGLPLASQYTVGPDAVSNALGRWPEIVPYTSLFSGYRWNAGVRIASNNAVAFFAIKVHGEDKAREFLAVLSDGVTANRNHPARMLRERLIKDKSSKIRMNPVSKFALGVKALNAFTEGEEVYQLRMRELGDKKESFPVVLGLKL